MCGFPKKTGSDDMMRWLLMMDGGNRKVLTQSLFFLRRGACLIVFDHVINHHRKDISPTHEKDLTGSFFFSQPQSEEKISMSLTRRSFIKKSSYSAAAVTAFGTGVGLANNPTYWIA
jgi:hypothetical protein